MPSWDATHYLLDVALKRDQDVPMDRYPFCLPAVRGLADSPLVFHPRVTFIVGENGSGKSTLLEAIAVAWGFNAEGGTRNFNFQTEATHSTLHQHQHLRLGRSGRRVKDGFFLRAESFYNVASNIDAVGAAGSYGGKSLHAQSHGESFMSLVQHRFGGQGLYVLDEPEAALSPTRQLALLVHLHALVQQHSQFIIATHSPILMAYPGADILQITDDGLRRAAYRDTEHYQVTRTFLENPERYLDRLLGDTELD